MVALKGITAAYTLFAVLQSLLQGIEAQTCPTEATRTDAKGPFYLANAPEGRFAPEEQLNDPTKRLHVQGTVFGNNCVPMKNVRVEAWYAGEPDADGNLYSVAGSDLNYRGYVTSNECGFYNFTQTFPALYPSRPIHHVHFRVSIADTNEELLVTQMYFEGFADSLSGRDLQVVSVETDAEGARSVVFDIFVDVEGTADSQSCETRAPSKNDLSQVGQPGITSDAKKNSSVAVAALILITALTHALPN